LSQTLALDKLSLAFRGDKLQVPSERVQEGLWRNDPLFRGFDVVSFVIQPWSNRIQVDRVKLRVSGPGLASQTILRPTTAVLNEFGDKELDDFIKTLARFRDAIAAVPDGLGPPTPRRAPRDLKRSRKDS
jgi:hypothetical protein